MASGDITTERLVAYVTGDLDRDASAEIERRLAGSEELRLSLRLVRALVATLDQDDTAAPDPEVFERVVSMRPARPEPARPEPERPERPDHSPGVLDDWLAAASRVVAELTFDSRLRPAALAGFRGGRDAYQLTYASPLGSVQLDIVPIDAGEPARWRIRGQISECETREGLFVALMKGRDEATRSETDERGYFRLETGPGDFDLLIAVAPRPLLIREVQVG